MVSVLPFYQTRRYFVFHLCLCTESVSHGHSMRLHMYCLYSELLHLRSLKCIMEMDKWKGETHFIPFQRVVGVFCFCSSHFIDHLKKLLFLPEKIKNTKLFATALNWNINHLCQFANGNCITMELKE